MRETELSKIISELKVVGENISKDNHTKLFEILTIYDERFGVVLLEIFKSENSKWYLKCTYQKQLNEFSSYMHEETFLISVFDIPRLYDLNNIATEAAKTTNTYEVTENER